MSDKTSKWKSFFSKQLALSSYSTTPYKIKINPLLRGRKFSKMSVLQVIKELNNISKLGAPPRAYAEKNRCNLKGEPMLYLSATEMPLPFELNAQINDIVAIIEYQVTEQLNPIAIVGVFSLRSSDLQLNSIFKNHLANKSDSCVKLDNQISDIFQKSRMLGGFDIYDLTIALTQIYLHKPNYKVSKVIKGLPPYAIGLIYPSVASGNNFNLVLKPKEAKKILKPVCAKIYTYMGAENYDSVFLRPEALSQKIYQNGEIKWSSALDKTCQKFIK